MVGLPVDVDGGGARNEERDGRRLAQGLRVRRHVEHLGRVDAGYPIEAAPTKVEARAVVRDVHRLPVARLPEKEFEVVDPCDRAAPLNHEGGSKRQQAEMQATVSVACDVVCYVICYAASRLGSDFSAGCYRQQRTRCV